MSAAVTQRTTLTLASACGEAAHCSGVAGRRRRRRTGRSRRRTGRRRTGRPRRRRTRGPRRSGLGRRRRRPLGGARRHARLRRGVGVRGRPVGRPVRLRPRLGRGPPMRLRLGRPDRLPVWFSVRRSHWFPVWFTVWRRSPHRLPLRRRTGFRATLHPLVDALTHRSVPLPPHVGADALGRRLARRRLCASGPY